MTFSDPYQAYVEGSVFSGNPLGTVIALYEGTIESVRQARFCLATGDILARSKAVSKAVTLLTELLVSLNHQEGAEISANLKRLYSYIQLRILEAHSRKADAPLEEAERLLGTMLEGWREAAEKMEAEARQSKSPSTFESYSYSSPAAQEEESFAYNFFVETPVMAGISATF